MKLEKKFPEKRVIITGAGSGLGRALALEFAALKWRIAVAEINTKRMKETAALIKKAGGKALEIPCDVTKPAEFTRALNTLKKEWGGVDILVNNAGVAAAGFMEKIPLPEWEWIMNINLKSLIYGCRTFIPLFKEQGSGYIVNVASNAGIAALPEMVSYNVTKAGVIALSETLRTELAPHNIGVSVVCPTFFKTNLMDQFTSPDERQRIMASTFFEKSRTTSEKVARHVVSSIKKGRLYVITQADGKFIWRMKRLNPQIMYSVIAWGYRKGIFDKYLGVS
ncbi:MAG: SDR family oxidoreductase [Spirochaetes bacterium]|nr:SDR family oxidoreductase [Spirochaetota bacterium]